MNFNTLSRWSLRLASLLVCLALWQVLSARHVNLGLVTFANVPARVTYSMLPGASRNRASSAATWAAACCGCSPVTCWPPSPASSWG